MGAFKINVGTPEAPQILVVGGANASVLVTSTTRPGLPFQGMVITETDTGFSYVWDGTKWIPLGGLDTGWVDITPIAGGDGTQFHSNTTTGVNYVRGRKVGNSFHIQFSRDLIADHNMASNTSGDFGNKQIMQLPSYWTPNYTYVTTVRAGVDAPQMVSLGVGGVLTWIGGTPGRNYAAGTTIQGDLTFIATS